MMATEEQARSLIATPDQARSPTALGLPPGFEGLGLWMIPEDLEALLGLREEVRKRRFAGKPWIFQDNDCLLKIVEVGSFVGRSALALANRGDVVYCVDTWCGGGADNVAEVYKIPGATEAIFGQFMRNCRDKLFGKIFPCRGPSVEWARDWPFQADMVFIDADHTEAAVRADLLAWRKHVKPGGVLCGHDYGCVVRDGDKEWGSEVHLAVDALIPHRQIAGASVWYEFV